jgi:hypothetical protein
MANVNTCAGYTASGTAKNQFPVTQTVATTVETALLLNTDAGTTTCFVVVPGGGSILGSSTGLDVNANFAVIERSAREYGLPSGETNDQFSSSNASGAVGSWDGRPFRVRICGVGTAGHNAAQTLIFNLYQGTSASLASDHAIGTTGAAYAIAQSSSNVSFNFMIEATLVWDLTSGVLTGSYTSNIAGGTTSQFTGPTVVTNVVGSMTSATLSFLASVTLGNAASSTISIREFVVDKL